MNTDIVLMINRNFSVHRRVHKRFLTTPLHTLFLHKLSLAICKLPDSYYTPCNAPPCNAPPSNAPPCNAPPCNAPPCNAPSFQCSTLQKCDILQPPAKPIQPRGSVSYKIVITTRTILAIQDASNVKRVQCVNVYQIYILDFVNTTILGAQVGMYLSRRCLSKCSIE